MTPRIVAHQGDAAYLVDVGGGKGRVLDMEQRRYFPAMPLESIAARGYWEPCRKTAAETRALFRRAGVKP